MAKVTRLTLDNGGNLDKRRLHLREIAEGEAPLDTVGQELSKARARRNEDLGQIAAILKIRKDHLEAIEESRFDALPGRTYAIGFVRTYANYLGLDAAQCLERLKAEIAGKGESKDSSISMSPPEERKLPQGGLIFAAVLLIAGAYGGYYLVNSANHMASQTTTPVPARLAAEAAAPDAAAAAGSASGAKPAAAVTLPVTIAGNAPSASTTAAPAPARDSGAAETVPEGTKYGQQNAGSRITLKIRREGRVDVIGPDNRVFLGRILKPGDTYRVPNIQGTVLNAADAGAVEVLIDGKSAGFAGQNGMPAENLKLNARDMVDRQKPAG